jgi:hypothetical protein
MERMSNLGAADAVKMQIRAQQHRRTADWLQTKGDQVAPRFERAAAKRLEHEAELMLGPLMHCSEPVSVGDGGEMAEAKEPTHQHGARAARHARDRLVRLEGAVAGSAPSYVVKMPADAMDDAKAVRAAIADHQRRTGYAGVVVLAPAWMTQSECWPAMAGILERRPAPLEAAADAVGHRLVMSVSSRPGRQTREAPDRRASYRQTTGARAEQCEL